MLISDQEIGDISEKAAIDAVNDYENLSKSDHLNMPEYWVACRIASELGRTGLIVECEKSIREIVGEVAELIGKRKTTIDIAVFGASDDNPNRPRALIEVKGSQSTWKSFIKQFERLHRMSGLVSSSDLLIGLIYISCRMELSKLGAEHERLKRELCPDVQLKRQNSEDGHCWGVLSIFKSSGLRADPETS